MNRLLGFGLALVSVSVADKPLGQYASASNGAPVFGGSGFGGGFEDDTGYSGGDGDNLEEVIPGIPGDDYPIFAEVPDTSFLCDGQVDGGYYSDPEADCQAFHICAADGTGGLTKYSFLCPNGTLFNQQYFVCDWWFNVDCSLAEDLYSLNDEYAAEREANSPADAGQSQYGGGNGGGRSGGGNGGRGGGRGNSGGSRRASASSPRGSYAAPSDYTFPEEFGPADGGYGAPPAGGYGAPGAGAASEGYSAPAYSGRRRNARQSDNADLIEEDTDTTDI